MYVPAHEGMDRAGLRALGTAGMRQGKTGHRRALQ